MLRLILKISPLGAGAGRASGTRHWLAGEKSPSGLPLVANPYHQMRLKGNIIYAPAGGPPESDYRERLAMIASPIVAFAEDFVDR